MADYSKYHDEFSQNGSLTFPTREELAEMPGHDLQALKMKCLDEKKRYVELRTGLFRNRDGMTPPNVTRNLAATIIWYRSLAELANVTRNLAATIIWYRSLAELAQTAQTIKKDARNTAIAAIQPERENAAAIAFLHAARRVLDKETYSRIWDEVVNVKPAT